ncbi:MAG: hypothetical protein RXR09_01015 [Acidilobus sp.]
MPPASPDAIARKLLEMLHRRRPDLKPVLDEISRSKGGQRSLSQLFSEAYEVYLSSLRLEEAFDYLVRQLESIHADYDDADLWDET